MKFLWRRLPISASLQAHSTIAPRSDDIGGKRRLSRHNPQSRSRRTCNIHKRHWSHPSFLAFAVLGRAVCSEAADTPVDILFMLGGFDMMHSDYPRCLRPTTRVTIRVPKVLCYHSLTIYWGMVFSGDLRYIPRCSVQHY